MNLTIYEHDIINKITTTQLVYLTQLWWYRRMLLMLFDHIRPVPRPALLSRELQISQFRQKASWTLLSCFQFIFHYCGSEKEDYLRVYTFSILCQIGPGLGSAPLIQGPQFYWAVERASLTLKPCNKFFSNIYGSTAEYFLRFNAFSLHGYICPTLACAWIFDTGARNFIIFVEFSMDIIAMYFIIFRYENKVENFWKFVPFCIFGPAYEALGMIKPWITQFGFLLS